MKNFSGITDNLDITTKKYVDDGLAEKANSSDLATVATSGSYNDLSNKLTAGSNISISGNTISATVPTNYVTTDTEQTITSKKTFNGEVKFGSTENFQGYYIKRMLGNLGAGTRYADLDSSYKDGTWHRMWRLRFPSGSSFWGKIKVTLYGDYSSFNASGVMSKSITCNFNTSNIYNNVGCYDGLGVNVEQDFRISEAIWNDAVSAWEVLIWQKNLRGNNPATIMLECWTKNNTNYINAFNGIAAQPVELTQSTSYSAQRASSTGGTKTVEWATLPVYENPLGEEIATMSDFANVVKTTGDQYIHGEKTFSNPILTQVQIGDSNRIYGASDSPVVDQYLPAKDGTFAMTSDIPDVSGKANLNGGNTFSGTQIFNNTVGNVTNQLVLNETQWDIFTCRDLTSPTTKTAVGKGFVWCQDSDAIYSQFKATGIYYGNDTSGYEGTLKFPTNISGEKTIATTDQIPDVSGKANLEGANEFIDGTNTFRDIDGTTQISGSQILLKAIGVMGSASLSVRTDNNNEVFKVESDSESGVIHLNKTISLNGDMGTAGQALITGGVNGVPKWADVTKHGCTELTNEDLNTITEAGWYYANANHSCTNTPASISAFWLEVSAPLLNSSSSTVIRQTLHAINYLPATSFVRESVNNKFASSWYHLEQMDESTGQKIVGTKTFVDGISLGSALRIQTSTNVGTGGTAGQVLTSTGPYSAPQWKAPSGSNTTVDSPMVNGVSYTVFDSGECGSFIGTFATEADETGMTITVGSTSYVLTETRQAINYRLTIDKNDQFVYSTIVVDGGIADKISSFSTVPSDGIVRISTNLSSSYMESNRCVIIKE